MVEETLARFTGTINQVPPVYSAVKVDGHRAYKMARSGQEVELKAKTLVIDSLELLSFSQNEITVRVVCSKGTYIRALARDIGTALKSGAHLSSLRRDAVGEATLDKALSIEEAVELMSESPMVIVDDNENEVNVPPILWDRAVSRNEEADIKPWCERTSAIPATLD